MRFSPGQYATIGFKRHGRPTPMRCFSIISTPRSGVLQFAMRIRGRFTATAAELQPGEEVRIQGPFGEFTVDSTYDERLVCFAGGIGITPFMSIIRDATERKLPIPITLLFSNRSAANIPFYDELRLLAEQNPHLRIRFYCSEGASEQSPSFVAGTITTDDIAQLTDRAYRGSTYFVCGPRGFSKHIQRTLQAHRVHESRILSESFTQSHSLLIGSRLSVRSLTYGLSAAALALGFGFFMVLDLKQTLPKLVRAQTPAASNTNSTNSTSSTSTANNSAAATGSVDQNTSTTPSQTQTYQAPVSSVS